MDAEFDVAGEPSPVPVAAWTRPLEDFALVFTATGLAITGIREPHFSERRLRDGPVVSRALHLLSVHADHGRLDYLNRTT
ncbi:MULTISPECIES: hypothetical protein [Protofrankia]|uniref:Uncharacterized protein n=1 Tax=Protofrankia coriariae TaxID=1562887 RepID=A0ABR5F088_9ACTN|nr:MULTISPECIES: hypothetical protein [Protofrankia]KLL10068.1 hypothetical protein FrCorBMG51_20425 [Protofrankia coriariae]ONH31831.1 hypothetical protein BL254_22400 [Protofrankia sp. BMG5.30]